MTLRFVVTEAPSWWNEKLEPHYERIRARLEDLAGTRVESVHYVRAESLGGASAVVISGSFAPWAAHDQDELARLGDSVRAYDGPVLGICAGMQLQASFAGGSYAPSKLVPATGFGPVEVVDADGLLRGLPAEPTVYKHHTEEIVDVPDGFRVVARSAECAVEAIEDPKRGWWGTQFHPEEFDDQHPAGELVLRNFFALAGV